MSTGQKYSGEGEDATQPVQNGSSIEQTVNSDPQAAKPTLLSETFSFDELVIFNELSDTAKSLVSGLVNSGQYQPETLKRALRHISQTPDTAPPSDEFNGESLQSILSEKTEPIFTIEGSRGAKVRPIVIEMPAFMCWHLQSPDRAHALIGAIERVFSEFRRSKAAEKFEDDLNQSLAYSALGLELVEMMEKAASQRLGSFEKDTNLDWLHKLPELATGDPELDQAPILADDPTSCTDLNKLQEWVIALQNMGRLQQKFNTTLQALTTEYKERAVIEDTLCEGLKRQIDALEQQLGASQKKAVREQQERDVPSAHSYIDLTLYLTDGYESEVELVRSALDEAASEKLTKIFGHITLDETEDAFFANEEYTKLQNILGRLSQATTEVANNNYQRHYYTDHPEGYLRSTKGKFNDQMGRKADFVEKYSVFTGHQQETDEEAKPEQTSE